MKILCHVGPWSDDYFKFVCKGMDANAVILLASAHKKIDESGISERYYDFLKTNKNKYYPLTDKDNDFISRCRLLRAIPLNQSLLHLNSMRDAITEAFDRFKPNLVLSETIDMYVIDLFHDESKRRNIQFVGLVTSFVNGYFRVSARGELNKLREPSEKEICSVLSLLEDRNYVPNFINDSKVKPYLSVIKRWMRNAIKPPYFACKRILSGEKYNFHYWATQLVSSEWFHFFPVLNLGDKDWINKLKLAGKPVIYVPLQMVPEATIDYWCDDVGVINFDKTLLQFVKKYSEKFHFLIKEHPNVLGYRNPVLYKQLTVFDSVTFCPTNTQSNDIMKSFDGVLVWTGTVGFELALRGKPVLSFCEPYYAKGDMFMRIKENTSTRDIEDFFRQCPKEIGDNRKKELVKHVLSGLIPGTLQVDGTWKPAKKSDVLSAVELGKNLRNYCIDFESGKY